MSKLESNGEHESGNTRADKWTAVERLANVLSLAAIPIVIAVIGGAIQGRLQDQTVARDYVQLAVTILRDPNKNATPSELRAWAVDLLNNNSQTKLSSAAASKLSSGDAILPTSSADRPAATVTPRVSELMVHLKVRDGEFLKYEVRAGGPIPIFAISSNVRGTLIQAPDFPGHPTKLYSWTFGKNGPFEQMEMLSVNFVFLTDSHYALHVDKMNKAGKILKTVKDVDYSGGPNAVATDSLTVVLEP